MTQQPLQQKITQYCTAEIFSKPQNIENLVRICGLLKAKGELFIYTWISVFVKGKHFVFIEDSDQDLRKMF